MRNELVPLQDILNEIRFLRSLRERQTFEGFRNSEVDVRAASYAILVISEAVRRIPDEWLAEHPEVPWHAIRTIGNKLRHEYQRVSEAILWDVVEAHANSLGATIEHMLYKRGGG